MGLILGRSPSGSNGELVLRHLGVEERPVSAAFAALPFFVLLTPTAACTSPLLGSPGRGCSLTPAGMSWMEGRAGWWHAGAVGYTAERLSVWSVGMRHRRSEIQPPDS